MRRNIIVIGVLGLGWLILNVYTTILWEIRDVASQLDVNTMILYHGIAIILCFALGLLLEHQSLVQFFTHKERLKPHSLFILVSYYSFYRSFHLCLFSIPRIASPSFS